MLPIRKLVQNINGLSTVKTSIHSTWQCISQYDIALISETQVVHSVQHETRSHHLFSIPASARNRRGEGPIIAVSKQLPYSASQWRKDTVNHVIWVTLKSPSAQLPPITVDLCYVPPITSHQMALSSVTDRFDTSTRHIRAAVAAAAAAATAAHIMVAGDFNAKVGNLPDPWVTTFNEDIPPRQSQDHSTNALGPHLMQLCEDTSMVLCTGRTLLDTPATPSYPRGNSRFDHTLVSPSLFPFIHSCGVFPPTQDSDHCPLIMKLHLPFMSPSTPSTHAIHSGTPVTRWVWDATKRPAYASSLQFSACDQVLQHSIQASSMHQLNQADNIFTSARTTACRSAGFRKKKPAPSSSNSTQHQRPAYWDQACRSLHCQWRRAERRNPGAPSTIALLAQLQTMLAARKRSFSNRDILTFANLYKTDPRKFFQQTCAPQSSLPSELTTPSAWHPLISKLTSPPAQTATHMPPPHQPQPPPANALNTPITAEEISLGLQRLHNGRAGALQGYSSEFLRYAKPLPTPESPAPANLIIPCIQAMFNEAYSSGKVPIQWQTALITPIFKHGDASDAANYRPIAVGEPLCRLYANILNHRLTQYTEQQQLRTHTQAGYRSHLSTVHQAFVLQHVIDKQTHAHEPLYLCFVDLKAAYDKVQWPLMWQVLQRPGIHGSMLTAVQSLYTDCSLAMTSKAPSGLGKRLQALYC